MEISKFLFASPEMQGCKLVLHELSVGMHQNASQLDITHDQIQTRKHRFGQVDVKVLKLCKITLCRRVVNEQTLSDCCRRDNVQCDSFR